jgi:DNA-binding CsgD family transcriptional regulator
MVGRTDELRRLRELVVGARYQGVVLAAPAGVGKTRLALECLSLAEDAGLATARVTATRAASRLPFGALALLLPPDPRGDRRVVDDRAELLRRYAAAIQRQARGRRMVLLVDDAHLLDDASATLIHQLAQTRTAVVVATVRAGEPAPDPIVALWKDQLAQRIELDVLPPEAIEDLVSSVLAGPVDQAVVAQLTARCQGNVLFLRELVEGALQDGTLRDDGGIWRLRGELSPSDRLLELVETRLGGLSPDERASLELVSFGEPLGQAELCTLADARVAELLEGKALVSSRMNGRRLEIWLAHPLYGDVTRARTHALREHSNARSLAEAVEATGARRRGDTLRVASWRLTGGGGSPELLLAGALAARLRHDYRLTEQLARAATGAGDRFEARFLAAEAAHLQGRTEQAQREFAALAGQASGDTQRARVAVTRFDNAFYRVGRPELGILEEAEAAITDPFWRDELLTRRLLVTVQSEGPRAGVQAAAVLLRRTTSGTPSFGYVVAAHSLARLGRIEDAIRLAERGANSDLAATTSGPWYRCSVLGAKVLPLVYAGRLDDAERLTTPIYRQAVEEGAAEAQAFLAWFLAILYLERGRVRTALRRARESLKLFGELGRSLHAREGFIAAVTALALAGRADEAAEVLAEIDALHVPRLLLRETDLLQARAWTAVAAGDLPQGRRRLEDAAELGQDVGDLIGEAAALHGLARLGHACDVADRLTALADSIDGDLVSARADHARALAHDDRGGLEKVSVVFEHLGADLLAAEAAADAAVACRQSGRRREATANEQRASNLVARCEGAATPALQPVDMRARLTTAEREAALLAAAGRSNKEMSQGLFISVRTVECHLQHVYDKLGVSGRSELAKALGADR